MGLGDEVMAAGEAWAIHDDCKVRIVDKFGRPRRHPLWDLCPYIEQNPASSAIEIRNAGHCRPYIDYEKTTPERWAWKSYKPKPAKLVFKPRAHRYVVVEPTIKMGAPTSKVWPGWSHFLKMGFTVTTIGPEAVKVRGVHHMRTRTLSEVCAVLGGARALVTHEGGLHHLAAAVGTPAVVLFGGFITPDQTGYVGHKNLWVDLPEAQGWRHANDHTALAWQSITPDLVADALRDIL